MPIVLFGIPNCDTVRKARRWLDERGLGHAFHDIRKDGLDVARLARWSERAGWEALLNRRGTSFRKLDPADREGLDEAKALGLMAAHPTLIRRPVVEHGTGLLIGFDAAEWERVFG